MIIKNVLVFTEEKKFEEGTINIENGLFTDTSTDGEVIDGDGCYAIPGLVDVHFHGCVGADFCDDGHFSTQRPHPTQEYIPLLFAGK